MLKTVRHLFLVLSVLLIAAGNMNIVSFCECSQNLFLSDCSCHAGTAVAPSSEDCSSSHGEAPCPRKDAPHHCHHLSLKSGDWMTSATVAAPHAILIPAFIAAVPLAWKGGLPFRELEPVATHSPPEPLLLTSVGGLGYCRPLLI